MKKINLSDSRSSVISYFLCINNCKISSILVLLLLLISTSNIYSQTTYTFGTSPAIDGATISTCAATIYDSGGSGSQYANNENIKVTFCSMTPGQQIKFILSGINIASGDTLRVYNGKNTSYPLLMLYTNTGTIATDTINSYSTGCLTMWFKSNASGVANGWAAAVSCIAGCSNSYEVCKGVSVNWMETSPGSGIGTLNFANLPSTSVEFFVFKKDFNGVLADYYASWDGGIVRNSHKIYGVPVGRTLFDFESYLVSDGSRTCLDLRQFDFGCCTMNISDVKVSDCFLKSGVSKATVCAQVSWFGAPLRDSINVTIGGITKYINTSTLQKLYLGPHDHDYDGNTAYVPGYVDMQFVSSQEICVEVNAGTTGAVSSSFVQAGCSATSSYTAPAPCPITSCTAGMLGGIVFEDFNADGIKQAGEYVGIAGVTVTVFNNAGVALAPVITNSSGRYVISVLASAYPIRVEFSGIPAIYGGGYSTINGTDGRTSVQFIAAADCNVDLGVNDPATFCQSNPIIITPIYKNGDPLLSGTSKTSNALLGFPQTNTGNPGTNTFAIQADKVGSLWGQAYNRKTKRLYSAAFLRRHVGLGPGGYDAIYITNLTTLTAPSVPVYFNLSTKGINVGTHVSNSERGLPANLNQPSLDTMDGIYRKIAAQGIGGIDISDTGNELWVVNVRDNSLNLLNLSTYNTSNNLADITRTGTYTIPSLGCVGGVQRSFACKYFKGKVYIGSLCDGSTSNRSNMMAAVYEFNPSTNTFTKVMDFPLTYPKGPSGVNGEADAFEASTGWYTWHQDYITLPLCQPIFMDIEFDVDGSMVLGFGDRKGFQIGFQNYGYDGSFAEQGVAGGDILRAVKTATGDFILENNATVSGITGYGPNNNQGPGLGEFYNDDTWADASSPALFHSETALGGLAIRPGSGITISSHMDPITLPQTVSQWWFSGGVRKYNNTNGTYVDGYQTYVTVDGFPDGTMAKASGMGDIELTCNLPDYIEIGNYVWFDQNRNGIQDATERRLAGVNVSLYKGTTLIATTTTNANGEYFFSSKSALSTGTWSGTGADTILLKTVSYNIVFGTGGQYNNTILDAGTYGSLKLTSSNTGQGSVPDLNDNDPVILAIATDTFPTISLTTGVEQYVNHTLDAGFFCDSIYVPITVTYPTCTLTTPNNNGTISITGTPINADKYRIRLGSNWTGAPDTSYTTASAITSPFPQIIQNNIPNAGATYIIRFYSGDLCYKDTVITIPVVSCTATCSLTGAGLSNVQCNSNGTPASTTDDYITFSLSPSGTLTGVSYTVTANNGGIVTPSSGTYGTNTNFRLQNGSANGATVYTLTITDSSGAPCQITVNLGPVSPCSSCPNPNCGGVNVTRN